MRAALDDLQDVLIAAIADLRRAIFALRPVDLEALGFVPALTQLVGDFGDQNQLVALVELSGPQGSLPPAYELPLFRVIQEGLSNIGQHARASSVLVRLAVDAAGGVAVSVRDNSRGFDPNPARPGRSCRPFRPAPDARAHPGPGRHAGHPQRDRPGHRVSDRFAPGR
jgi:signal transduction histidine kinase